MTSCKTPRLGLSRLAFAAALIGAATLASGSAHAQATIDQNKVLAGSFTPGDTPGFPLTLSVPGSYKLTSNLYVPANTTGIYVTSPNVTLDLNGFSIIGPNTCSQNASTLAVTCTDSGGARGVAAESGGTDMTVKNGNIIGFDAYCISSNTGGRFENLNLRMCGSGLFQTDNNPRRPTLVAQVEVALVKQDGISINRGLVKDSMVSQAGGAGIFGYSENTLIQSCHVSLSNVGVQSSVVREVVSARNTTNFLNTDSAGGNMNGKTPY